jgi:hypothetical protein
LFFRVDANATPAELRDQIKVRAPLNKHVRDAVYKSYGMQRDKWPDFRLS